MELRFLGGAREIGRSAVLVDDRLLLDYGVQSGTPPRYPPDVEPEAVVVSHGHFDHVGAVPALLSGRDRPPVHWTPPTREFARLLAEDTLRLRGGRFDCPFTRAELARLSEVSVPHGYGEPFSACAACNAAGESSGLGPRDAGYEVTFYDAGHVPGSAHVLVDDGDTRLLYTGDFSTGRHRGSEAPSSHTNRLAEPVRGQRLVASSTARPDADVVVTESTYSDVERPPREAIERRFAERVRTTVHDGGTVVVPAFAIGRTQEVMLVCEAHDVECYVDGMGVTVAERLRGTPEFLRDPEAFRRACAHARFVDGRDGQRRRIAEENTVIVTTAGMLSGGPAMTYVPAIAGDPTNLVAFSGYQVEGTPGRELLDTGSAEFDGRHRRVAARVEQFDFSAHADRSGLLGFLDSYRDAEVLVVHGDRCAAFAEELRDGGFDAGAPERNEVYTR